MKKQVKLAIAAVILLGSVNVMAEEYDEFYIENQQNKVRAAEADFNIRTQLELVKNEADRLINILGTSGPEGSLQETGLGQLSDLAQRNYDRAQQTESKDELDELLESSNQVKATLEQIKSHYNLK